MSRYLTLIVVCVLAADPSTTTASPYERPTAKMPDPMGYVSDHAKVLESIGGRESVLWHRIWNGRLGWRWSS